MIRIALPKSRNLDSALAALEVAQVDVSVFSSRLLRQVLPLHQELAGGERELEVLLIKDWDLPLYVEYGIVDCGFVGTDVLEEHGADLLTPLRLASGRCRISLIGREARPPGEGEQIRVCTKYPNWSRRLLAKRSWGAEVFRLWGSVELGPILHLAEVAVDIVQTGTTLREHDLHELEVLAEIAPTFVISRAGFQRQRAALNDLMARFEAGNVVGD